MILAVTETVNFSSHLTIVRNSGTGMNRNNIKTVALSRNDNDRASPPVTIVESYILSQGGTCVMPESHNQKKRKLDNDDENHVEDKSDAEALVPSGKCERNEQ